MSDTITVDQVVKFLVRESRPIIEENKNEIIEDIENYLESSGFMGRVVSFISRPFMSNFLWDFTNSKVVPLVMHVVVFVLIKAMSARLKPFRVIISEVVGVVDSNILPEGDKDVINGLVSLMTLPENSLSTTMRMTEQ